jgi:molecular chaperone IbpA
MTKQLRITTSDLFNSPLFKVAVGFDRMFDDLASTASFASSGYPPYNVARINKENSEDTYEITLAVAGFTMDDIEITVENRQLKVTGTSTIDAEPVDGTVEYLHKGIAERNFNREWRLAEHVEVESAKLRDGLLRIRLTRNVPEAQKPKRIAIGI